MESTSGAVGPGTALVALHGFSVNGAVMRAQLEAVLPARAIVAPDAPHACAADAVDRLYAMWDEPRRLPPHLMWWDASDDGREYRGWDETRELMRPILAAGPVGLIGFSQGAILATALAAMSAHGEMPPIRFAILIGGRPPRADVLLPFLARPIEVPSLHVWGEADTLVGDGPRALLELYAPATREVVSWPGAHSIPTTGPAADAIARFIARQG
jgi:pimeloyl-ACP methyl ester carboxylesterase